MVSFGDRTTLLFLIHSISKCPRIAQTAGWLFRCRALLCVTRQLDKVCVRDVTDYSRSMGALFKIRKNPLLPMKLGEK